MYTALQEGPGPGLAPTPLSPSGPATEGVMKSSGQAWTRSAGQPGQGDLTLHGAPPAAQTASATTPSLFPLILPGPVSGETVVVGCLIRGFFPLGPLNVSWNVSEGDVIFPPVPSPPSSLYTTSSLLSLTIEECPKCVICHVEHNEVHRDLILPCPDCSIPPITCGEPSLSLQRPDIGDLLLESKASLTCTLSGLKDPEGAVFTWEPTNGNEPVQQSVQSYPCGCYSVSSVLPGCAEPWNAGTEFTCTVTHPEIEGGSLTAKISRGNLTAPQVHLLPPPSEELANNALVTLTCLVQGFSPKDVLVSWTNKGTVVLKESYLVWKPLPEPGQEPTTYAVTNLLRVPAED
uniref:Ig-like domain-containing protein n=1 Tax=Oryctolagus cuniculus TaxID=9986 RepID=G1TY57_RABIT